MPIPNILIETELDLKCICLLPDNFFKRLLENNKQLKQVNFIINNIELAIHDDSYPHLRPHLSTLEKSYGIDKVGLHSISRSATLSATAPNETNESIYKKFLENLREDNLHHRQLEKPIQTIEKEKSIKKIIQITPDSDTPSHTPSQTVIKEEKAPNEEL